MSAPVLIPTYTTVSNVGGNMTITTYYDNGVISILIIFPDMSGTLDGVPFAEGDVLIVADQLFYIDGNGDLWVISLDAANFSIDGFGDMIYTF
jgi:hypothetical protein